MIVHVFIQRLGSSFEMIRTCLNMIKTKSLEDVCLTIKSTVPFSFIMHTLVEDTLMEAKLLQKFRKADSLSQPYSKMPMNITKYACVANN